MIKLAQGRSFRELKNKRFASLMTGKGGGFS
jgi:hypothetical protein